MVIWPRQCQSAERMAAGRRALLIVVPFVVAAAFAAFVPSVLTTRRARDRDDGATENGAASGAALPREHLPPPHGFAGSRACAPCHSAELEAWRGSHHARAERSVDPQLDALAFSRGSPPAKGLGVRAPSLTEHGAEVDVETKSRRFETVSAVAVVGDWPLRQLAIARDGGRIQMLDVAMDPNDGSWFSIFGKERRTHSDWGHWTGRGLNWNSMCAACHNTGLRKGYNLATDTYQTTRAESAVGCEACHGPRGRHVEAKTRGSASPAVPTPQFPNPAVLLDACAACHARRTELTGQFTSGDAFLDHFAPSVPDLSETFYPDGQVREEDYEWTSFVSSKMGNAGVTCQDCHEPHGGKVRTAGDGLCLRCHATGEHSAPRIEVARHVFHPSPGLGSACVDCHMPQTTYMGRHARHDHGFTIPDPRMTVGNGTPNACNRCHKTKDASWATARVEQWYGTKMERPTRTRAECVARARDGKPGAGACVVEMAEHERIPMWRAVGVRLMARFANDSSAMASLVARLGDPEALVRVASATTLGELPRLPPHAVKPLRAARADSVRAVRVASAWALRGDARSDDRAEHDLDAYLAAVADQPAGRAQAGTLALARGDSARAIHEYETAVAWDPTSSAARRELALAYSVGNRPGDARNALAEACRLAPQSGDFRFELGLAENELGHVEAARASFAKAVMLSPNHARAWYNLALMQNAAHEREAAVESLRRSEVAAPEDASVRYLHALVLRELGRLTEALAEATRAVDLAPADRESRRLRDDLARRLR